jgi:hypothetical protein
VSTPGVVFAALLAVDAPAKLAEARAKAGLPPDPPVCAPAWPELALVCARVADGEGRRLLRTSELAGRTADAVLAEARASARTRLAAAELLPVAGTPHRYLQLVDADGAAAAFLFPEQLAERLGGAPLRVAVPVDGVVIAWKAAGPELDKIGAVAVREVYDQGLAQGAGQGVAVSAQIVDWDGARWTTFGQATPRPATGAPASP